MFSVALLHCIINVHRMEYMKTINLQYIHVHMYIYQLMIFRLGGFDILLYIDSYPSPSVTFFHRGSNMH